MTEITLQTNQLGLKNPAKVKTTFRNQEIVNDMYVYSLKLALKNTKDISQLEGEDLTRELLARAETDIEASRKAIDFVQTILKLNPKQVDSLETNTDTSDLIQWVQYVVYRFKGFSDEDYQSSLVDDTTEENPKDEPDASGEN